MPSIRKRDWSLAHLELLKPCSALKGFKATTRSTRFLGPNADWAIRGLASTNGPLGRTFRHTATGLLTLYVALHRDGDTSAPSPFEALLFPISPKHGSVRPKRESKRTPSDPVDEGFIDGPAIAVFRNVSDIPISMGNINLQPQDVQYLGSYNWVDTSEPTIIVPGSPRVLRERDLPYALPQHQGRTFIDENGHRMKARALLPLIAAVDTTAACSGSGPFDWVSVDLVTDRGNLRWLMAFLCDRWKRKEFRIDVQLAGTNTLLFTRWERNTIAYCGDDDCFARSFEAHGADPAPGCEHCLSHHRIIAYNYDGLKMVLRCEVDACRPFGSDVANETGQFFQTKDDQQWDAYNGPLPDTPSWYHPLEVMLGGTIVPQDCLVELKTVGGKSKHLAWKRVFPQLFFSQTNHLIVGVHHNGTIHRVRAETLASEPARMQLQMYESEYRRLGSLLRAIRDVVVARGREARLSIVGVRGQGLEIRERRTSRSCLPEQTLRRFEGRT